MNPREYLSRINIEAAEEPSYRFLEKLQHHHLTNVPFENLDIIRGKKIILDEKLIYEKVVVRSRGGFCYELNGLFCWLLNRLGFSASMVSARVYMAEEDRFTPEFDHMVLLVSIDRTYLVDVGFGDSFMKPIKMEEGAVEDISGVYRLRTSQPGPEEYLVQKREQDEWRAQYSFATYPRQMADFEEMCIFHQTAPESPFMQGAFCTMATERGRVTLSENSLTITEGVEKRKILVVSTEHYRQMLREYFGIELEET